MNKNIIFLLFFLTACDLSPDYIKPEITVPQQWKNKDSNNFSSQVPEAKISEEKWWKSFGSDELPALISQATTENNDLIAAAARIEQSRALARIAGSPLLPSIATSGSLNRSLGSDSRNSYQAGGQIAYELDLFGRIRNSADAAGESFAASIYDREALRLSITAQVAQGYFNLLALNERVQIAVNNLNNANEILRVTQSRFDAGALSQLELSQQKNLVSNQESSLASLGQQKEAAQNSLAVLLSVAPSIFSLKENTLFKLSPPEVTAIIPGELLTRRPDLQSLEAQMRAANFNIGAARAAFLPAIGLNASSLLSASPLTAAASSISTLAAAVSMPLFTGGSLEGQLENATARQQELAANYRKAALTAYSEAENALSNIRSTSLRLTSLSQAAIEAQKAADIANAKFKAGAIDFESLLSTQNSLLQAQDSLIQARADRLSAAVELFRALGGGFPEN